MMTRKSRAKGDHAFQMIFFFFSNRKYWQKVEGFLNITIIHSYRSKNIVSVVTKNSTFALGKICSLRETLVFQYFY